MIKPPTATQPFSIGDAALDGVRVIRENWRLMVGWTVFCVVATLALTITTVIVMVTLATLGSAVFGQSVGALLAGLGSLLIMVMIVAALNRLCLRAEDPEFLYLRLGADELRLLVVAVMLWLGGLGVLAAGVSFTAWVQRLHGTPAAWVSGTVSATVLIWLAMRLCLTVQATIERRRFGFLDAWRVSRGRSASLLGVNLIAFCLLMMAAVIGWFALWLAVGAVSGFQEPGLLTLDAEAFSDHPLQSLVQMIGEIFLIPVLLTLAQAPLIAAWRAFRR